MRGGHERDVLTFALLAGAPATVVSLALLFATAQGVGVKVAVTLALVASWLGFAAAVRGRVRHSLRTLANLLSALREGDSSIRGRVDGRDALAEVTGEVNALAESYREQRLGTLEANALLRTVMTEMDVAIFAFDEGPALRLVNRAGERLLGRPAEQLLGRTASDIGLSDALSDDRPTLDLALPGGSGRWGVKRGRFRQEGRVHLLVVLADLSRALHQEEHEAWQRLIRVMGHELNNSLTPIRSIAGSLERSMKRHPRPADWDEDVGRGLAVIASRVESLGRFMDAYGRLARLPKPRLAPMAVDAVVRRAAGFETRLMVDVEESTPVDVFADVDQIEQALINLLRNAADAALETGGGVRVGWSLRPDEVDIKVDDDGPGLLESANLFVPFFTTKAEGSGIGLVLSRQIAEAHGGALSLRNREGMCGCRATLTLPRAER